MAVGLLRGDPAFVDQGLDEGVVLGYLGEFAVAQQVAAGVTDVHEPNLVAREQDCGERRAHALQVGLHLDVIGDGLIAGADRCFELAQQIATGLVVVEMG